MERKHIFDDVKRDSVGPAGSGSPEPSPRTASFAAEVPAGYGDLYPTTVSGRIIGIGLMMLGIGFLAVLTATVAS